MGSADGEDLEAELGAPGEPRPQVAGIASAGVSGVAGQEPADGEAGLIEERCGRGNELSGCGSVHGNLLGVGGGSARSPCTPPASGRPTAAPKPTGSRPTRTVPLPGSMLGHRHCERVPGRGGGRSYALAVKPSASLPNRSHGSEQKGVLGESTTVDERVRIAPRHRDGSPDHLTGRGLFDAPGPPARWESVSIWVGLAGQRLFRQESGLNARSK